jgi:putative flippase GtrA
MKPLSKYPALLVERPRLAVTLYRTVQVVRDFRYARYLVVSAISLGVDLANFFLMLEVNVPAVQSSILGYVSGLAAHWLLSSRLVFADKMPSTLAAQGRQKLLFVISALMGLAITAAVIECGLRLGIKPGLSKLAAIAFSFHVTYLIRRRFVFL